MLLNKEILIGIYGSKRKPTFSVIPDVSTIIEGEAVTFAVNSTNVPDGTILYWTTLQIAGSINSSDFTDNLLSGSVVINSNAGTITRVLIEDLITEATEIFQLELRIDSVSGPVIAISNTVAIVEPFKMEIDTTLI